MELGEVPVVSIADADVSVGISGPQQKALERDLQRVSLAYYASQNLTGAPEYGGKFMLGPHHLEWDRLIQEKKHICVLAPRDHGKSHFFTLAFPIWKAAHGKRGDIGYIFSASQPRSREILELVKAELLENKKLAHLVPHNWASRWSADRIRLANGVEIRARGFGVKVRGGHPRWIVCDDILDDTHLFSETNRKRAEEQFFGAISNMLVPGGQMIVVGTPFHRADLYARIKSSGVYTMWWRAAMEDEKALWPLRYNEELLEFKKKEIGSVRFTREFLVQPVSDEMSIFPSYLFDGAPVMQSSVAMSLDGEYWDEMGVESRFMGIDIAISTNVGADYFVIYCIGLDADRNRWTCWLERHKGMPFNAQKARISDVAKQFKPGLIYIESNAMQSVWGDDLIRETDLPIKKFITSAQGKHSLEKGVPSLRTLLENKKWRIPRGDAHSIKVTDEWIDEMAAFSWQDGKVESVAEHDDMAMACWIADQAARQGAFTFSFGNAEASAEPDEVAGGDKDHGLTAAEPGAMKRSPRKNGKVDGSKEQGYDDGDPEDPSAAMLWGNVNLP